MTKQTKQLLAVGAGLVLVYLLYKSRMVTTSSSAAEKKEMAEPDYKNYVDVNSNSFFKTVSTRDPRDIKV